MKLFLLVYDPKRGQLLETRPFDASERAQALGERFRIEREHPGWEVVVLSARSEDDLRRTHRRYFSGVHEMAVG